MPIVGQWGGERGLMAMLIAMLRGDSPEDVKDAAADQLLLLADQIDEENGLGEEEEDDANEQGGGVELEPEGRETGVAASRGSETSAFWERIDRAPKP
jgi:hypothetical protein